jgi:hypothetical protein
VLSIYRNTHYRDPYKQSVLSYNFSYKYSKICFLRLRLLWRHVWLVIYLNTYSAAWVGEPSWYSDWRRTGRSGDCVPVGARFFAPVQTVPLAHPASCTMGTGSFPGVKSGRSVTLTPHPLLVPLVMKEWSYISTPPMGRTACTEPQCLYKCAVYLTLLPYSAADDTGAFHIARVRHVTSLCGVQPTSNYNS